MPNTFTRAENFDAYHFIRVGFFNSGTTLMFFPMPGAEDMREVTSSTGAGERLSFLFPFDGSVETIWARSEYASGSTVIRTYIGTTAIEVPSAIGGTAVTVDMSVDDTSYEFDFAGGGSNTFSQGNILMFSVIPTTQLGDCHFMIVLKFDTST